MGIARGVRENISYLQVPYFSDYPFIRPIISILLYTFVIFILAGELACLRDSEEKYKQQCFEVSHRERILVRRLASKEQQLLGYLVRLVSFLQFLFIFFLFQNNNTSVFLLNSNRRIK